MERMVVTNLELLYFSKSYMTSVTLLDFKWVSKIFTVFVVVTARQRSCGGQCFQSYLTVLGGGVLRDHDALDLTVSLFSRPPSQTWDLAVHGPFHCE